MLVVDSLNAVRSQVLLRGLRDLPVEGDDKLQVAGSFAAARAGRTYSASVYANIECLSNARSHRYQHVYDTPEMLILSHAAACTSEIPVSGDYSLTGIERDCMY